MRFRVDAVFKVSIRTVRETIPKLIGYFLVRMSQEKLSSELHMKINENDQILESLGEPKHITERRQTLSQIIQVLKDSLKVLQRDPDITAASSVDDSELAEELRKDAMQRKQEALNKAGGPGGPPAGQMNKPMGAAAQPPPQQRQMNGPGGPGGQPPNRGGPGGPPPGHGGPGG
jgi:hypothetical protein